MKKIFIIILLFISYTNMGQEKLHYQYNGEEIKYSRIDYSKYGIVHIFVNMYEESDENKKIEKEATLFLANQKNLYHTLYFFIEVSRKYSLADKEIIFNEIMKEIENKENLKNFNLYLNFDIDYSDKYQREVIEHKIINKVKRVFTNINSKNIINGL
ncbi:hypothetical protein [Flavobacterium sp. SOK18b]|uniref:hypothetical protein n=1 Tax=Flavobacterium sp. SOK18b TaxID=797900 RepID=UPI0015FC0EE0|nr:hypothetical protein [Flavobacterium sp. SOK18b]